MNIGLAILMMAVVVASTGTVTGQDLVKVNGRVLDSDNREPLPNVHIRSSKSIVVSDVDGNFSVTAATRDSLLVTHIGYHDVLVSVGEKSDTLSIFLERSTRYLTEITVSDIISEEQLKEKVLETTITISREEENANANLQNIRTLYALGYRTEMNDYELFRESMKAPEGASILSSKGGGIIKAIKNLANPPSVNLPQRRQYSRPMTNVRYFKPMPVPKDTLARDSVSVDQQKSQ